MAQRAKSYLLAVFLILAGEVSAQALSSEQEAVAQKVFGTVLSPYCPGRLLSDCPSGAASDLKQKIRVKLSEGADEQAIMSYLYDQYGEEKLRSTPKAEGFGLVGWLVPALFTILGLGVLWGWFKSTNNEPQSIPESTIDPELASRIERDLQN